MRRVLMGFVVAAITAVVPALALADNQEVAEQIARSLRSSGQLSDYKIGVKYQDGTVWLRGHVSSPEQIKSALTLVFQTPGVTRVVNELSTTSAKSSESPATESTSQLAAKSGDADNSQVRGNPLRSRPVAPEKAQPQQPSLAQRLESVFSPTSAVETVSAEETQEVPQMIETPQRAKPVAKPARTTAKVAMLQPGTRGPAATNAAPLPMYSASARAGVAPVRYDQPCMPNYAWPSYAAYPNYAGVTYPKQYSPTAWPYIGPFYPYPQVPLGWRKVTLEWDSGWWFLDFKDQPASTWHR